MGVEFFAIAVAVLVVILFLIYRRLISTFDYFEKKGVVGPKPVAIFGTWSGIWKKFQGEHDLVHGKEYGKVYGTFDGKTPNLIVSEPSFVQAILGREAGSFRDRRAQCVSNPLLEQSLLLMSSNEKISQSSPTFVVHEKLRSLTPLFLRAAEYLRQRIAGSIKEEEGRVNISKHVDSYLADTLALGVFGLDLNQSELKKQFSKYCNQAFLNSTPTSALSLIPFLYPSLGSQDGFVMSKGSLSFFTTLCQSTISGKRENEKHQSAQVRDIVSLYIEAAAIEKETLTKLKGVEDSPTLSDQRILAECLAVILNSSLLTRNLVALSIHTLATNSDVQDKLKSELSKNVHSENTISYDAIQGSKYLTMFMNEVARLYPSEFRVERVCSDAMEVEKYKIEKGTAVSIPVYALHRSEEFYPKPEEFDPTRFSAENAENRNPLTFLPFGQLGSTAGSVSVQFSVLAAKLAVAHLVKSVKFSPAEETQIPAKFAIGFTGVLRPQEIIVNAEARRN